MVAMVLPVSVVERALIFHRVSTTLGRFYIVFYRKRRKKCAPVALERHSAVLAALSPRKFHCATEAGSYGITTRS